MLIEFIKLPLKRILFWLGLMFVIGSFILFAIVNSEFQKYLWVGRIAAFFATFSIGLLIVSLFSKFISKNRYIVEAIVFSFISIVLCSLVFEVLNLSDLTVSYVIENAFMALLFPLYGLIFYLLKVQSSSV
jgi:hypothetical protein